MRNFEARSSLLIHLPCHSNDPRRMILQSSGSTKPSLFTYFLVPPAMNDLRKTSLTGLVPCPPAKTMMWHRQKMVYHRSENLTDLNRPAPPTFPILGHRLSCPPAPLLFLLSGFFPRSSSYSKQKACNFKRSWSLCMIEVGPGQPITELMQMMR